MKKNILAVCSVMAISGLSLAAQQPPAQTPPTQQTPPSQPAQRPPDPTTEPANPSPQSPAPVTRSQPSSDMARTSTTVTGCLKAWDSRTMAPATGSGSGAGSAASPTSSAPAATGAASQFVLTNVDRAGAASRASASSFLLKTSDSSVSFSQHLNHKVELTGTVSDSAKSMGETPSADRDASASGRVSTSDMKLPTMEVTALKMVSPTCGTGS